jgi:hypothetical protein
VSSLQPPLELSVPYAIEGATPSTAGTPVPVQIRGNAFELVALNRSADYDMYVSLDLGVTWIRVPPDCALRLVLGSFPDPLILIKSDGASQPFAIIYRLRL